MTVQSSAFTVWGGAVQVVAHEGLLPRLLPGHHSSHYSSSPFLLWLLLPASTPAEGAILWAEGEYGAMCRGRGEGNRVMYGGLSPCGAMIGGTLCSRRGGAHKGPKWLMLTSPHIPVGVGWELHSCAHTIQWGVGMPGAAVGWGLHVHAVQLGGGGSVLYGLPCAAHTMCGPCWCYPLGHVVPRGLYVGQSWYGEYRVLWCDGAYMFACNEHWNLDFLVEMSVHASESWSYY